MKTASRVGIFVTSLACLPLLLAEAATAASPTFIGGDWKGVSNQTAVTLNIIQFASIGVCKPIGGNMSGVVNAIQGYYCPVTGRIVFARRTVVGGVLTPFQFYEGHVSRDGVIDRIGGSFAVFNPSGGGFANEGVDFNFSATK